MQSSIRVIDPRSSGILVNERTGQGVREFQLERAIDCYFLHGLNRSLCIRSCRVRPQNPARVEKPSSSKPRVAKNKHGCRWLEPILQVRALSVLDFSRDHDGSPYGFGWFGPRGGGARSFRSGQLHPAWQRAPPLGLLRPGWKSRLRCLQVHRPDFLPVVRRQRGPREHRQQRVQQQPSTGEHPRLRLLSIKPGELWRLHLHHPERLPVLRWLRWSRQDQHQRKPSSLRALGRPSRASIGHVSSKVESGTEL